MFILVNCIDWCAIKLYSILLKKFCVMTPGKDKLITKHDFKKLPLSEKKIFDNS